MKMKIFCIAMLFLSVRVVWAGEPESLDNVISRTLKAYERINDYTCRFSKKELVKGKIRKSSNVILKFMKPQHIYFQWTEGKNKGIETIYAEGKYDGKLIVHLNGFFRFITVSLDPKGSMAMRNHRHPVTEAGIGHIVRLIGENYSRARSDTDCVLHKGEDILIGKRKTIPIRAVFPPGKGYYGHIVRIRIDREIFLPVKISVRGWNREFLEEYIFEDIKTGVGLTEKDFSTKNPDYNF